jgi:hypothetical protein
MPARRDDALDGAAAEARNAQQHLALGGVDVDRETVAMLERQASFGSMSSGSMPPSVAAATSSMAKA